MRCLHDRMWYVSHVTSRTRNVLRQIQVLSEEWRVFIIIPGHGSGQITSWASAVDIGQKIGSSVRGRIGSTTEWVFGFGWNVASLVSRVSAALDSPLYHGSQQIPRATFYPHPQIHPHYSSSLSSSWLIHSDRSSSSLSSSSGQIKAWKLLCGSVTRGSLIHWRLLQNCGGSCLTLSEGLTYCYLALKVQ